MTLHSENNIFLFLLRALLSAAFGKYTAHGECQAWHQHEWFTALCPDDLEDKVIFYLHPHCPQKPAARTAKP